eukprot:ANDGO_07336.mRNA.1 hypothetical protein
MDDYLDPTSDDFLGGEYIGGVLDEDADDFNDETFDAGEEWQMPTQAVSLDQLGLGFSSAVSLQASAKQAMGAAGMDDEEEDFDDLANDILQATKAAHGEIDDQFDASEVVAFLPPADPISESGPRMMTQSDLEFVNKCLVLSYSIEDAWNEDYYYLAFTSRRDPASFRAGFLPPNLTEFATPSKSPAEMSKDESSDRQLGKVAPFSLRRPRMSLDLPHSLLSAEIKGSSKAKLHVQAALEDCFSLVLSLEGMQSALIELQRRGFPPNHSQVESILQKRRSMLEKVVSVFGSSVTILSELSALRRGVFLFARLLRVLTASPDDVFILRPLLVHCFYYAPQIAASLLEHRQDPHAHPIMKTADNGRVPVFLRAIGEKMNMLTPGIANELMKLLSSKRTRSFSEFMDYGSQYPEIVLTMVGMLLEAGYRVCSSNEADSREWSKNFSPLSALYPELQRYIESQGASGSRPAGEVSAWKAFLISLENARNARST